MTRGNMRIGDEAEDLDEAAMNAAMRELFAATQAQLHTLDKRLGIVLVVASGKLRCFAANVPTNIAQIILRETAEGTIRSAEQILNTGPTQ